VQTVAAACLAAPHQHCAPPLMGLYDRDYTRYGEQPGFQLSAPQSATTKLVIITAAAYVAQLTISGFTEHLALWSDWYAEPWKAYTLLTYGFLHADDAFGGQADIAHILINMLILWMFGREVEQRYGQRQFVAFYLSAIVLSGLAWSLLESAVGTRAALVGASGGVAGVVTLFALNFPHRRVLFMFVIPMPMWVAALIGVGYDALGAARRTGEVAYTAHLMGAAYGALFYYYRVSALSLIEPLLSKAKQRNRPRLRVVQNEEDESDDLGRQVDEILAKIKEHGQDSLTRSERRILERASREYQQKRR
jgi:membrane associated rhomboid family serine protease